MGQPTEEQIKKQGLMSATLKLLELPPGISWKYEIAHDPDAEEAKAEGLQYFTTRPPDVVNFYQDGNVIGRAYFLKEPIEFESLDRRFEKIEAGLRQKLGLE